VDVCTEVLVAVLVAVATDVVVGMMVLVVAAVVVDVVLLVPDATEIRPCSCWKVNEAAMSPAITPDQLLSVGCGQLNCAVFTYIDGFWPSSGR
jgi:hypothetical protein